MKTAKEYSDTAKREVSVDVDALLAAINEISESEVHRSQNDSEHVSVDGREYHTWRELADYQHHQPLDEIGFKGGDITAEYHDKSCNNGNNNHADRFIHPQQDRAHAGEPLVYGSGVGEQKNKDNRDTELLHNAAAKSLVEKLGHGFYFQPPSGLSRAPGQHQPGQQRAEYCVTDARQNAPQAVFPAGAARVADKHHRGKIRGTV